MKPETLKSLPKGSKILLFNPRVTERKVIVKNEKKGNYIVQMRYVGETNYRHHGFGSNLFELIQDIKDKKSMYCQYRIIDLDTNKIIFSEIEESKRERL